MAERGLADERNRVESRRIARLNPLRFLEIENLAHSHSAGSVSPIMPASGSTPAPCSPIPPGPLRCESTLCAQHHAPKRESYAEASTDWRRRRVRRMSSRRMHQDGAADNDVPVEEMLLKCSYVCVYVC
jgi:hypothetical protein